jgi:putative ABC transport system substrate-binding protein
MRRRDFIAGLGGAAAWPLAARAQQAPLPVIGFLSNQTENVGTPTAVAVRQGLGEQGYVEGRNVEILYRWTDQLTDRSAVEDLVRRRVSVIITPGGGTAAALAAKAATAAIPIVFAVGSDPVEIGLVASLNRPGGNVTGSTRLVQELTAKHLELLHGIVPAATSIGFLVDPRVPYAVAQLREAETAADLLGVRLVILKASSPGEIETVFGSLVERQIGALLVGAGVFFFGSQRDNLTSLAARRKIPAIYPFHEFTAAGGLMSYGMDLSDAYRQVGVYAGRILKGDKPADLPVQQATKFNFFINLKTAKALGLTIPETLLATADEVIE